MFKWRAVATRAAEPLPVSFFHSETFAVPNDAKSGECFRFFRIFEGATAQLC